MNLRWALLCLSISTLTAQVEVKKHITKGPAQTVVANLYPCPVKVGNHRISAVGSITATDGTVLTVPAETASQRNQLPLAADLYNECTQITPRDEAAVNAAAVPTVIVDPDGEVITGYIVADNYFELYVNGKLVAVDNTPFTPFNSAIVKFKAKRPITYAFKVVDWEENLGLATEANRGDRWHPGDGGLIARINDGTVTDSTWKVQSFYIGPLNSPDEVIEHNNRHDTSKLGRVHPLSRKPQCADQCYAVHYPFPTNWERSGFPDSSWPQAYEYTDEEVGVTNLPAYTRYPGFFKGARDLVNQLCLRQRRSRAQNRTLNTLSRG